MFYFVESYKTELFKIHLINKDRGSATNLIEFEVFRGQ